MLIQAARLEDAKIESAGLRRIIFGASIAASEDSIEAALDDHSPRESDVIAIASHEVVTLSDICKGLSYLNILETQTVVHARQ